MNKYVITLVRKLIFDKKFAEYLEIEFHDTFYRALNYNEWKDESQFQFDCRVALETYELNKTAVDMEWGE